VTETSQKVENLATKVAEATTAKTDVKVQLIDYSTQLTSARTALTDRLKLVLDTLELKGGDPKEYRLYIASIAGVKIDVTDKTATWARIKYWATADEGGLRWARNLGIFSGYILGSIVLAWIVRIIMRRLMGVGQVSSHLLQDFLVAMSGRVIVFVGVLLGLSAPEVNLAPLLAVIGAVGFVIAFALQGTLSNFASGLLIMVNKPFDVNDEVEVGGGIKGQVAAVSIFNTLIQTEDGLKMIVPNNSIWNGVIVNHTTRIVSNPTAAETKPA
jgi:small conductance mechanosensitive channel